MSLSAVKHHDRKAAEAAAAEVITPTEVREAIAFLGSTTLNPLFARLVVKAYSKRIKPPGVAYSSGVETPRLSAVSATS